ncbi:pantetheine-phosphate adenylyltransferase [Arcobacter sp. FWKO B]|uniref:pantetheine-phosphate adenylyltransferase n=1 Tax=Arcobacter sp. FWKO B TaxID=2593672 RepID=UPI0018A53875|nr:pantetheine-phosphate adenylyltransferase [Arcobacter sp. FWKO B]QOG13141.1 pantetheine-phosphate adenylyltransferase [Arcobacter sp. FWKO B]
MKKAIYCGTFDPITNGHMDIIKRGLSVFDEIILGVAESKSKNTMFNLEKRLELARIATKELNITVKPFNTLLVEFAKSEGVYTIIRGLRAISDFEYELQMGYANNSLDNKVDTIYFMPTLNNAFVSSTVVREILKFGGDVSHLVPKEVKECISQ